MPITIQLRTIPGRIERHDGYDVKSLEPFGPSLGQGSATVATVADVRGAVRAFGARVRAAHPDASFAVSVSLQKGGRKPAGWDKAARNNGFGQEDRLRVVDARPVRDAGSPKPVGAVGPSA